MASGGGSGSNGSQNLSAFVQGGNSFGANAVLGTNDFFNVILRAGGTNAWQISSVNGELIPHPDNGTPSIGSIADLVREVYTENGYFVVASGDSEPSASYGYDGVRLGPGGATPTDFAALSRGVDSVNSYLYGIVGAFELHYGDVDPSTGTGVPGNSYALYIRTDGTLWIKFDAGDTDWTLVGPARYFFGVAGLLSDYDNDDILGITGQGLPISRVEANLEVAEDADVDFDVVLITRATGAVFATLASVTIPVGDLEVDASFTPVIPTPTQKVKILVQAVGTVGKSLGVLVK